MKKVIFIFFILIFLCSNVKAETIIYDNLTTNSYKSIRIYDDLDIKYINEVQYEVYIDNQFLGYYSKDELIFIPDNSNVSIYIPSNINIDFENVYSNSKSYFIIGIGIIFTFGIIIIFLFKIFNGLRKL